MRLRPITLLLLTAAAAVPIGVLTWWTGNSIPATLTAAATAAAGAYQFARNVRITEGQTTSPYLTEDPVDVLRRRIRGVNQAFAEAAKLMQELQRDFAAQEAARDALIAQAEEQRQVLSVNRDEAEKIRKILASETKESIRAGKR